MGNSGQRQFLQGIGRRPPPTPPPVRDAACGGGEAFLPAGASAVADSLQELSLSGVTHCPEFPPFTLLILPGPLGLHNAFSRVNARLGKSLLNSILAFSLTFHAITLERSSFRKIAILFF